MELEWTARIQMPYLVGPSDTMKCRELLLLQEVIDQRAASTLFPLTARDLRVLDFDCRPINFAEISAFWMRLHTEAFDDAFYFFVHGETILCVIASKVS
jgi:hypothetical protein